MPDLPTFSFEEYSFDPHSGALVFSYEISRDGEQFRFSDTLRFDTALITETPQQYPDAFRALLENLHLALGISYWKLFCPAKISIKPYSLSRIQAQFWNTVYTKGLGEFFYRNSIDYRGLVQFPSHEIPAPDIRTVSVPDRSLSLLGGGKDSVVTAEFLKKNKFDADAFVINPNEIHRAVASTASLKIIPVSRIIDPKLFSMNERSDTYNGHVPISSIYAWIAVMAAFLYGYRYVIASNERSADIGNVDYLGTVINHQWSKSFEFESMFTQYISQFVVEGITYFSLLRKMNEFEITGLFCSYPQYFHDITSCNTAFRIRTGSKNQPKWCGVCPKCAFMYLMLSAYLPQQTVQSMFGKDLFSDRNLITLYSQLFGITGFKPFECVGTPLECVQAYRKMIRDFPDTDPGIIRDIAQKSERTPGLHGHAPEQESAHAIPERFSAILK